MRNKNMQFGTYLWPNRQNSCFLLEIGVGEHDGDVRSLTGSRNEAVLRMRNKKYAIWPLLVAIAKIPESRSKYGSGNMMVTSDFWPEIEICNLDNTYGPIAKIPASYMKSGSAITMVTSDF